MKTAPLRPIAEAYWVVPGLLLAGEYPGSFHSRESYARIVTFLERGIKTFVDLTVLGELVPYEIMLMREAEQRELQAFYSRFSIADRGVPSERVMRKILDTLDTAISEGRTTYLHCWGGVGRTGTVVGCYLVRHGLTGEQALAQLAEWWQYVPKHQIYPRSPETDEQMQFILNWKE
jgi:hypothetical protein